MIKNLVAAILIALSSWGALAQSPALSNAAKLRSMMVFVTDPAYAGGAKCDGSTDDTAAFAAAKAAAVTAGKALYIPAGTCKTSISLSGTDDNLRIVGESIEKTILEAKNNSAATIEIAAGAHNVTVEELTIKNTSGGNNGTHYGIWSRGDGAGNGNSYLKLRRIKVDGYNINVRLDEFNGHILESLWLSAAVHGGFAAPAGANLYAGHAVTHSVGLWMRDLHAFNGKYGFYFETTEGIAMTDSESLLATENAFIHVTGTAGVTGMTVQNSQFDSAGNGAMLLQKVFNGSFSNLWLSSGASAAGAGAFGLKMDASDNNAFSAIQAYSSTTDGVWITNGSQKNNFAALQCVSNGSDCVQIDNGSWGNSFTGTAAWNNTGKAFNFNDTTADEPNTVTAAYDRGNGVASTFQAKDVVTGGNYNAGRSATYIYYRQNWPDGFAAADISAVPNTDSQVFVVPHAGSLTSITVALNDTRVAGTLSIRPKVNGAVKDSLRVQIDGTNTQYIYLEVTPGTVPVAAGDRIGVYVDSDVAWDTTGAAGTVDFNVTVGLTTR